MICMGALMKEIEGLSEESKAKVVAFVHFMKYTEENEKKAKTEKAKRPKRTYGIFKGSLKYMADDFDETPECFKEYM